MLWLYSRSLQLNFCSDLNQKYFFKTKTFFVICIPKVKYSSLMQWFNTRPKTQTYCSVAQSCLTLRPHGLQHARLPCPSPSPRVCSNSCPFNWWCHPTISSSATLFSFCLQSFPASGSFPINQLFTSGGQSIRASASVLLMNIQDWFPLTLTGLILQSTGLSRIFSNTTARKHQFLGIQPSLWSNSHILTWLLENQFWWDRALLAK